MAKKVASIFHFFIFFSEQKLNQINRLFFDKNHDFILI